MEMIIDKMVWRVMAMPRSGRIVYNGAIYHVYQRGNNREYVFSYDDLKEFVIEQIKKYNSKFDFELLAYCIMDNHYHLIIRTFKHSISEVMFNINNVLGKALNNKLGRRGHIFEGRFKSELVETEEYLIWLLRYVHRNPVRAHMCRNVNEYYWRSSNYLYRGYFDSNVNTDFILDILSNDRKKAIGIYKRLMASTGFDDDKAQDFEVIKNEFKLTEKYLVVERKGNTPSTDTRKTIDEIINILDIHESQITQIRSGCRSRALTPIKKKIIEAILQHKYSLKEISNYLNCSPSALSQLLK